MQFESFLALQNFITLWALLSEISQKKKKNNNEKSILQLHTKSTYGSSATSFGCTNASPTLIPTTHSLPTNPISQTSVQKNTRKRKSQSSHSTSHNYTPKVLLKPPKTALHSPTMIPTTHSLPTNPIAQTSVQKNTRKRKSQSSHSKPPKTVLKNTNKAKLTFLFQPQYWSSPHFLP